MSPPPAPPGTSLLPLYRQRRQRRLRQRRRRLPSRRPTRKLSPGTTSGKKPSFQSTRCPARLKATVCSRTIPSPAFDKKSKKSKRNWTRRYCKELGFHATFSYPLSAPPERKECNGARFPGSSPSEKLTAFRSYRWAVGQSRRRRETREALKRRLGFCSVPFFQRRNER